jgi:hypothetical protein
MNYLLTIDWFLLRFANICWPLLRGSAFLSRLSVGVAKKVGS